ncbi:MAG: RNA methyltransferase [Acidobacteria bacterium]|nr:RNA methyltransferase [Acidobacteriota bacterium]
MTVISSRQHASVKVCRAIVRGDDERLLLDGWHLLADALTARIRIETLAIVEQAVTGDHGGLVRRAQGAGATVLHVTPDVLATMSPVRTPSGVVAIASRPEVPREALVAPAPALVVAACGVQDPGNVGALVRSADAGAATGVLLDGACADPWGWKALRASMGSAFRVPTLRTPTALDEIAHLQERGAMVVATTPRDGLPWHAVDMTRPTVIVLGGEGQGIPPEVLARADRRVTIPMRAGVESLNVAVAAALIVYEAARQRAAVPA